MSAVVLSWVYSIWRGLKPTAMGKCSAVTVSTTEISLKDCRPPSLPVDWSPSPSW